MGLLSGKGFFVTGLCLLGCVTVFLNGKEAAPHYWRYIMGTETEAATQDTFQAMKRSMLVGMNPKTEEVCQVSILKEHTPQIGHILNGSLVQILQNRETRFVQTFVSCTDKMRPSCHGIDEKYTSECVTVFKSAPAMVRLFNSRGPYTMEFIRVPIFCECRLRRQYRDFERPEKEEEDENDDLK